ncbi:MAG: flagellar biosynthetic protein FliR [Gemmatimonadota bacterium]
MKSLLELMGPSSWPAFALVSARVSGVLMIAPLWSMTSVPRTIRAAIAVVITIMLLPGAHPVHLPEEVYGMPILLGSELILGLAIGLTASVLMQGFALAGEVASLQMGLSLGNALTPMPEVPVSGIGELKSYFALAIYVGMSGHLMLISGLGESLVTIPPGGALNLADGGHFALALGGTVFSTGVRAAAPVMVALFLANVALAVVSKAVPQLNVMMVAFPITISVGLMVLAASLPFVGSLLAGAVSGLPGAVTGTIHAYAPVVR